MTLLSSGLFSCEFCCLCLCLITSILYSETDNLSAQNVRHNCKIAFDAGEVLGIPRVIDPADMDVLTVPDKLAVMTYLYQLRAHFTGAY